MNPKLGRKVRDRPRAQHACVGRRPRRNRGHVLLHPPECMIDAAEEHHFRGTRDQPLGCEFAQQRNRIMVQLPPTDGIQVPEQIDHVRMPCPPQIVGQRQTLVVQGFRTHRTSRRFVPVPRDLRFDLAHGIFPSASVNQPSTLFTRPLFITIWQPTGKAYDWPAGLGRLDRIGTTFQSQSAAAPLCITLRYSNWQPPYGDFRVASGRFPDYAIIPLTQTD